MWTTGDREAWLAAALVVALLLAAGAGTLATADPVEAGDGAPTTWYVAIQPDGDARVTVTTRYPLSTANETRAFRRLAAEFRNGTTTALSIGTFERAANLSSAATGREMAISGVERSSRIENDTGVLVLSFNWTGFARTPEDRIEFGDVFRTPSGTWLPGLTERQELIIAVPPRYDPTSLSWPLRNESVYIRGPATFDPGQPAATFRQSTPVTSATATPTAGSPTPTVSSTPSATPTEGTGSVTPQGNLIGLVLGVLIALTLIAALAYLVRSRDDGVPGAGSTDGGDDGDTPPDATAAASEGPATDGDAETGTEDGPLLSDEERVLELLIENDGRMKQAAIVRETDWSNAKVSQLLSEMDESGEIEKLRIGRENLITLPEERPEGVE